MLAAALLLPSLLAPGTDPPPDAVKLNEPRVEYRNNEASATRSPWIDANGWRMLRSPGKTFVYQVKGEAAALAAAEAFAYDGRALISTDPPGAESFGRMLAFLKTVPQVDLPPVSDFGVGDQGSAASGELLNLLTRMNLLYRIEKSSASPVPEARDPSVAAHQIRSKLGDDNRSLRVYGSEVVIGRLLAGPRQARVILLNYAASPVLGLRVRVRGAYSTGELRVPGAPASQLADWTEDGPATEFTVPELHAIAIIDLSRR